MARLELEGGMASSRDDADLKKANLTLMKEDGRTIRSKNRWVSFIAAISPIQNFANMTTAAVLAMMLAWWMVGFLRAKDYTGANYLKDFLLILVGGALGWGGKALRNGKDQPPQGAPD